jgi:hypothetical protein
MVEYWFNWWFRWGNLFNEITMTDVDDLDAKGKLFTYSLGVALISLGVYFLIQAYKKLKDD